ncbi:MAG: diguanylate cyclase [Chlamydiota bacterium]
MKLGTQLVIIFTLIIVSTVGTIGFLFFRTVEAIQFDRLRETLTAYAASAAMLIDGDRHALLAGPSAMSSPYYRELRDRLRLFMRIDPRIAEMYTMARSAKPGFYVFVVDASPPRDKDGDGVISETEKPAELGEEYDISALPEMRKAFDAPIADLKVNKDKWGWWLSAYAPVYDSRGKAVGIVGLDVSADTIRQQQTSLKRLILAISAVFLALGLIAANIYAYRLTRPLRAMVAAAREIGKGNYEHRMTDAPRNEIGFLAGTMNSMAENIRRSFDKLSTLNRTANILASTLDSEQALRISLNLALEVTRSSRGVIFLLDRTDRRIDLAISEGIEGLRLDGGGFRVGETRIPVALEEDREAQVRRWCEATGCTQSLPLMVKDTLRGYFLLNPEIHDEEYLNTLMQQVAFAIDNARLFHDAITDGLTGLFLKRYLEMQLDIEARRALRNGRDMTLMMIDIDHFKKVNDTYGHLQGDAVLREVARALKACVRDVDVVARWGGEEMAMIFPDTGLAQARAIAERILGEVGGKKFPCEAGVLAVTVSIGIFTLRGGTALAPEEAIRRADEALYRAKKGGRNRAEAWEEA